MAEDFHKCDRVIQDVICTNQGKGKGYDNVWLTRTRTYYVLNTIYSKGLKTKVSPACAVLVLVNGQLKSAKPLLPLNEMRGFWRV